MKNLLITMTAMMLANTAAAQYIPPEPYRGYSQQDSWRQQQQQRDQQRQQQELLRLQRENNRILKKQQDDMRKRQLGICVKDFANGGCI